MNRVLILISILIIHGCSNAQSPKMNNKVEELFADRIGVKPPSELIEFWNNPKEEYKRFKIGDYGYFEFLYPKQILKETLEAPNNYSRVNLSNSYYNSMDKGKMTRVEYDSLVKLMDRDPMLLSQDVQKWLVYDMGKHLNLRYAITIGVPISNDYSSRLFYGFDAAKNPLGVFFWTIQYIELPVFMGNSINDVIGKNTGIEDVDYSKYIEQNSHSFAKVENHLSLPKNSEEIATNLILFYETSYRKVFGDSLKIDRQESYWDFTMYKNGTPAMFRVNDSRVNWQQLKRINTYLNLHVHNYERPEFYSFYRLKYGYVAVLSKEQAIDFAQKGLIEFDHFSTPLEIFTNEKMESKRRTILKEEFQKLSEEQKEQFLKDIKN